MTIHEKDFSMRAHHQWASRPNDQRFTSLTEMLDFKNRIRQLSEGKVISSRAIEVVAHPTDIRALTVVGPNGSPVAATHWSFGQLASLVDAPAKYLRNLPGQLAADCLNYGFLRRDVEDVGVLVLHDAESGIHQLSAATGPNYGRIWDAEVIQALINMFGDGVTGDFKVPGIWGQDVVVDKENTTLYASDRDMFVFLADEKNRVEIDDRRNGKPGGLARGVFAWNSEVGKTTMGFATFLFDEVCQNRIVWGGRRYQELTIRHTASAPDKFLEELRPAIETYAKGDMGDIETIVKAAKQARLDTDVAEFLAKRTPFSRSRVAAMIAAHDADENRPMETVWDAVTGITAYARGIQHQDARVDVEREAGKLLDLVAA